MSIASNSTAHQASGPAARRAWVAVLIVATVLGLAACGSGSSTSTASTAADPSHKTAAASPHLCTDLQSLVRTMSNLSTAFSKSSSSAGFAAIRSTGASTKTDFDRIAPAFTKDLANAPATVRSAWSGIAQQLDEELGIVVAATSPSELAQKVSAFQASTTNATNGQAFDNYTKSACPKVAQG